MVQLAAQPVLCVIAGTMGTSRKVCAGVQRASGLREGAAGVGDPWEVAAACIEQRGCSGSCGHGFIGRGVVAHFCIQRSASSVDTGTGSASSG